MNKICPFCNSSFPLIYNTMNKIPCNFGSGRPHYTAEDMGEFKVDTVFYLCPSCKKTIIEVIGNDKLKNLCVPILPNSTARQFPEYVPNFVREDYKEAYAILNLSPKASATLSRRCLQGMIRDFWGITKSRLIDEINELKTKVSSTQWQAIDALRSIGNIGAHMEKDVNIIVDIEPNEAEQLLKLLELLINKWYIARHDEEELLHSVSNIATSKKS